MPSPQFDDAVRSTHDFEGTSVGIEDDEDTRDSMQRRAVYEGLRQRDAWLRKAWGKRFVAPEFE